MDKTHPPAGRLSLAVVGMLLVALVVGCGSDDSDGNGKDGKDERRSPGDYFGAVMGAHKIGQATACAANLRNLGKALQLYAAMHDGKFPASLDDLVKQRMVPNNSMLKCPSSDGKPYVYTPPKTMHAPPATIIARDADPVHRGKVNVLRLDGSVRPLSPEEVDRQ